MFRLSIIAALVASTCASLLAQGGPPLKTDDPGTPGSGHWEINLAVTAEQTHGEKVFELPRLDINYGQGARVQIKYEVPWELMPTPEGHVSGAGNSIIGVKWRFLDEDRHGAALSMYPQFQFLSTPAAVRRGLAERNWELLLPMEFEKSFKFISVNAELGYNIRQRDKDQLIYGLAVGRDLTRSFELVSEAHGTCLRDSRENQILFNVGARWKLSSRLTLLMAGGRVVVHPSQTESNKFAYFATQFNF